MGFKPVLDMPRIDCTILNNDIQYYTDQFKANVEQIEAASDEKW